MTQSETQRCKKQVADYSMRFPLYHQCRFKASKDGFCKIHHPDSVKAREEKSRIKYEAERAKSPYVLLQKATERNKELEREVTALTAQLAEARRDTINDCWNAINAHIQTGPLEGNGLDKQAQRNGMVLASNLVAAMKEPK